MIVEKPTRAIRTYVQDLAAPPERVFPLLCPVRETEWVEGWDPLFVASASGLATKRATPGSRSAWSDPVRSRLTAQCTFGSRPRRSATRCTHATTAAAPSR